MMGPSIATAMNSRLKSRAVAVWEAKLTPGSTTFTSTAQSRRTTAPMLRRAPSRLVFSVSAALVQQTAASGALVRQGQCSRRRLSIRINTPGSRARHTRRALHPSSVRIQ